MAGVLSLLKRAWRWRGVRWFAATFATHFAPTLISWSQHAYEFFAAGPNSGRQFPGLSVLGFAAGAATIAALIACIGFAMDIVQRWRGQ